MTQPRKTNERPYKSPADECRERGWGVGTRLAGDEGYGVTVIEITAIGEEKLLAKTLSHDGRNGSMSYGPRDESSWVLYCRDWTVVA